MKFDCVPGKTTMHSLYIEEDGFYYGQCAEICGRYHHHMPIRLYACEFSKFIIWWSQVGMFRSMPSDFNDDSEIGINNKKQKSLISKCNQGLLYQKHGDAKDIYYNTDYIW